MSRLASAQHLLSIRAQGATFASGTYGFDSYAYWTSSRNSVNTTQAYFLNPGLSTPFWNRATKTDASLRVRPIRSF